MRGILTTVIRLVDIRINGKVMSGQELYDYKIMVLEDFIEGGKLRDKLDDKMKRKVNLSYKEITAFVDLKW
ncbi:hypothetical protein [uncultured Gemella sp.]|uniref:hypothetical protein n=1 Tax=uncultured Gemella sp. TaxID=254352 RepID=UPI0028D6531B|nr:hypothetical protein [uncultured Gemella sp.]